MDQEKAPAVKRLRASTARPGSRIHVVKTS